jgi:hypothetical protein
MYDKVSALQKSLRFITNEYCESLNFNDLKAPRVVDYVIVVIRVSIAVCVAVVVVIALVAVKRIKKKNADVLGTKSKQELRAPRKNK